MDFFTRVVAWNTERGLIAKGFNHKKEASFIIEELLESTGEHDSVSSRAEAEALAENMVTSEVPTQPEKAVDAFADIIVFATGAIAKLGYDPSKVMDEVYKEINSRTGTLIDGKFVKDATVKPYEADLAACRYQ